MELKKDSDVIRSIREFKIVNCPAAQPEKTGLRAECWFVDQGRVVLPAARRHGDGVRVAEVTDPPARQRGSQEGSAAGDARERQ